MEKYRVKQIGNKFYPQKKWLCFWVGLYDVEARFTDSYPAPCHGALFHKSEPKLQSFNDVYLHTVGYRFDSYESAREYINEYKERVNTPIEYKGHTIIRTGDDMFVDTSHNVYETKWHTVYTIYGDELERVKEKIDKREERIRASKIRKVYKVD